MRGDLRAVGVRSMPRIPRPDWSERILSVRRDRQRRRLERLETIEHLERVERAGRRAGEHIPDVGTIRRWC
jgi:hypothetical protein